MAAPFKRILIICKTYPSPSAKYAETSCIAGIDDDGKLVRLYPVPFRMLSDPRKFKKWQWIRARVERSRNDRRPESFKLLYDTIQLQGKPLSTTANWRERRSWLQKLEVFDDFQALEKARQERGVTLALLRPEKIERLDITHAKSPEWSDAEKEKLLQIHNQLKLFDSGDAQHLQLLKKLPYEFHYEYRSGGRTWVHKIVDWEAGALFWNVYIRHGAAWEQPFRQKMEHDLPATDFKFLMGTIHRFPDQWLIVSLLYPPRQSASGFQGHLFQE